MKKSFQKLISVVLVALMLITPLSSGIFVLAKQQNFVPDNLDDVIISVPETIYLKPSTGKATEGQYYVNNPIVVDGNGNHVLSVEASPDAAAAYVGIFVPDAISFSYDITTVTSGIGNFDTNEDEKTISMVDGFGEIKNDDGSITNSNGVSAGETALIKWTFSVNMQDGTKRTYYAYSVLYSPYYTPVGAATRIDLTGSRPFATSVAWVSGVHSFFIESSITNSGAYQGTYYAKTNNKSLVPLIKDIEDGDGTDGVTGWISESPSGETVSQATIRYASHEGNTGILLTEVSPIATLTVDTSRYNNFDQIPNFTVGFNVTDIEDAEDSFWYLSDFTSEARNGDATVKSDRWAKNSYDETPTSYFSTSGTIIAGSKTVNHGGDAGYYVPCEYDGVWSRAIDDDTTATEIKDYVIKGALHTASSGTNQNGRAYGINFAKLRVTNIDKELLRTAVTSSVGFDKNNYTTESWNKYEAALQDAAARLGNPVATDVSTKALTDAVNNLQTIVTLDANGGTISGSTTTTVAATIGKNETFNFVEASNYSATRIGYTFLGWSTSKDADTPDTILNLGFKPTLYAVWSKNLTIDTNEGVGTNNLIYIPSKNTTFTAGNEQTITSTVTLGEDGVNLEGKYLGHASNFERTLTLDLWVYLEHGKTYEYSFNSDNAITEFFLFPNGEVKDFASFSNSSSGFCSGEFTCGEIGGKIGGTWNQSSNTTGYYQIRLDQNCGADSPEVLNDYKITNFVIREVSGDATNKINRPTGSSITITEPVRPGYTFAGWSSELYGNITGTKYTFGNNDDKIVAQWAEKTYTINYITNGGSAIIDSTHNSYTITSNRKLPITYLKGSKFLGWKVYEADADSNWEEGIIYNDINGQYGNVTLEAVFAIATYEITFSIADDLNINFDERLREFAYGNAINIPNPTRPGYSFAGWRVSAVDGSEDSSWILADLITPETPTATSITLSSNTIGDATLTPEWTLISYNVTYDTDGGEPIGNKPYDITDSFELPTPTRYGYTFNGWIASQGEHNWNESPYEGGKTINKKYGNVTLVADWTANDYTVTFDADGGEVDPEFQGYSVVDTIRIPTPVKTGYSFTGWQVKDDTGNNWSGTFYGDTYVSGKYGNVTLVAKWEIIKYTIKYETLTTNITLESTEYTVNDNVVVSDISRPGFTFGGWTVTTADGSWKQSDIIQPGANGQGKYGNITLTAKWTATPYTITLINADEIADKEIPYNITTAVSLPTLNRGGYIFSGWKVVDTAVDSNWAKDNTAHTNTDGKYGNVTLEPDFKAIKYEITFNPDGGSGVPEYLIYTADYSDPLPTPTKTGYDFTGWKVTVDGGNWNKDEVIENGASITGKYGKVTLTAQWERSMHKITWVGAEGVLDTVEIAYGDTPEFNGEPTKASTEEYEYKFIGWSPAVVPVTGNATYTALFEEILREYTVTWKYDTAVGTTETKTEKFKYGEYPVFNNGAIPEKESEPGSNIVYRFTGWSPAVAAVTGNITYVAQFEEKEATIKVTWEIDGKSQDTWWAINEKPEYLGTPIKSDAEGYKYTFAGWSPEPEIITKEGEYTYTAQFTKELQTYTATFNLNGGTSTLDTVVEYTREELDLYMVTRSGYTFDGWKVITTDGNWEKGAIYNGIIKDKWGNVTFEAQWTPRPYNITVYSSDKKDTYNIESTGTLSTDITTDITNEGYVLAGWIIVEAAGNWTKGEIVALDMPLKGMYGNVTISPLWTAKPYTLTLNSGAYTQTVEIAYGDYIGDYDPVSKHGYSAKWDAEIPEIMPAENLTFNAVYRPIEYYLNFDVAGGEAIDGRYYNIESTGAIPTPTRTGADFSHWVVAEGYGSWYKGMEVKDGTQLSGNYGSATFIAQWKLKIFTVTWVVEGVEKETQWYYGSYPAYYGTPYKAPDDNNSYKFVGWDKTLEPVTEDVKYTALFEPTERTYTVTWNIDNRLVTENYNPGDTPVYKGEIPTRPETNDYEYTFIGWKTADGEDLTDDTKITGDVTYIAQFKANVKLLSIRIDKTSLFINVGDEAVLTAILSPATATNKDIIWSSSDESVVTIDENGKVTAVGAGVSIICVQSANGELRAYSVVIVEPVTTQYIIVSAGGLSTTRLPGESIQLTATVMPENATNKTVTWTSSNPSVATVDPESGLVTFGDVIGTAVISATADGYATGSIEVATTKNEEEVIDRVKTYIVSFNVSTSQYIIAGKVYDNISIVYAEGDTVEFLLTEPHFAMANGVQLERDTDGVFRIENIQQNYVISTTTRADIGFEDETDTEKPKMSFFDKLKAFFQTIIDFFRNLFR